MRLLPALRRLDLKRFDGSDAAPLCDSPDYPEALFSLFESTSEALSDAEGDSAGRLAGGWRGKKTRLEMLDGKPLDAADPHRKANDLALEALEAAEKAEKLNASVQRALREAQEACEHVSALSLSEGDASQEVCQTARENLKLNIQAALDEAHAELAKARLLAASFRKVAGASVSSNV